MCAHSNYVNTTSTRDQVLLMLSALDTVYHLEAGVLPLSSSSRLPHSSRIV